MKNYATLILALISITIGAQTTFQFEAPYAPIGNRNASQNITASISYQGYDEDQAYFGQGEYEIFIDTTDGLLNKPIIVLDGFDPGDSRDITGLYNNLNFGGENLADVLRSEGYDIVILNAPQYTTGGKEIDGGGDYIQRNAMVLIELIDFLNTEKVGDEELVILGPSMGGLIGRYALAFMENQNMDAQTRLYISLDSPHKGANIPISLQYLINYLAISVNNVESQSTIDNVLNSPAAKEMLIDHLLGHVVEGEIDQDPSNLIPTGAPDFRDVFQSELDDLGFASNVRNVSVINGSGIGTTTGSPGILVVDTTLDLAPGTTADVIVRFTPPANETETVIDFETFLAGISIEAYTADAQSLSITDGVDAAPGGTSNISEALGNGTADPIVQDFVDALEQDQFCFIPTISALAIENEDNWYATPDIGNTHSSAFVNTFIPAENEDHVFISEESAQFILDEIRDGSLSVEDVLQTSGFFTLLENPSSPTINLQIDNNTNILSAHARIFNVAGQLVFDQLFTKPNSVLSIETSLKKGLYLLEIETNLNTQKFKVLMK